MGAFVGFIELFLRGKRVPAPSAAIVKRGAPAGAITAAFVSCLVYAAAVTIYMFGAGDEQQYFLASGAAVQTLANVLR
jgi:hypothetical protein